MGVVHSPDSGFAQEMRKWEPYHSEYGPPGRPYMFREYPTRMYQAGRNEAGKSVILEAATANDEHERRNLESRGYVVGGQQAAMDALEQSEREIATLAAERNFFEQKMSPKAQAEAESANAAAGMRHLASVPVRPIVKRRGRPKKVETVE